MNAFDTVELEPITGPVAPEPTVDVWLLAHWGLTILLLLALLLLAGWLVRRWIRHGSLERQPSSIRSMRKTWRRLHSGAMDPLDADIDALWNSLRDYLTETGLVREAMPTLEDVRRATGKMDSSAAFHRDSLRDLIEQVEQVKYVGPGAQPDRGRIVDAFTRLFGEILAHHR